MRKASSVGSAAKAVVDHLRDWLLGTNRVVCMGVCSEGQFGIVPGIFFSMPVRCSKGEYTVVSDIELGPHIREMINESQEELVEERKLEIAFEQVMDKSKVHE